jgi:hypothetical protein
MGRGRIANLSGFTEPEPPSFAENLLNISTPLVQLSLSALLFTILTFFSLALYLHLLSRTGFLPTMKLWTILLIVSASFLSLAAAESMATYLFRPALIYHIFGVSHWMNAPWIIANAAILILLYRKAIKIEWTAPLELDRMC